MASQRLIAVFVGEGRATRLIDGDVTNEAAVDTYTASWQAAEGTSQSERRRVETSLKHHGTKMIATEAVYAF